MKVGIIGAGITGLSAGYELSKQGHQVVIFEQAPVAGGLGTYIPIGDTFLERYYHHFFDSDQLIKKYAEELGISSKLHFYPSNNAIFIENKIHPFSSPKDLFSYSQLSLFDQLRCAVSTAFFKFCPKPLSFLDNISAVDWVKTYAGHNVYKKLWGPLLEGKFSEFAASVPALWLWGRVYDRTPKLGYFDGSVKILFDQLIKAITKHKGKVLLNTPVSAVETKGKKVGITSNNKTQLFDKVIITTVSPIADKLMKDDLPKEYRDSLNVIDHLGAVCVILELKHKVQDAYWVNICEKNAPVLVMIEHTNFISDNEYQGKHLVYLANYLHRETKRFKQSDEKVIQTYSSVLKQINPAFKKSWIERAYVSRVPRAQTIFQLGALHRKPEMKTQMPNVYLANIDQMYPHDRNLNQGIELGMKVTQML